MLIPVESCGLVAMKHDPARAENRETRRSLRHRAAVIVKLDAQRMEMARRSRYRRHSNGVRKMQRCAVLCSASHPNRIARSQ